MKKEAEGLRRHLIRGIEVQVTGIGARRTQSDLQEFFHRQRPSLLIFTGTAGQLDPALELGEIVFPEAWRVEGGPVYSCHPGLVERLRERGWKVSGLGLTVSSPVIRPHKRRELFERTGARICDMEAAVTLEVAARHQVPVLAPKIVADTASSGIFAFWSRLDANLKLLAAYLEELLAALEDPRHRGVF